MAHGFDLREAHGVDLRETHGFNPGETLGFNLREALGLKSISAHGGRQTAHLIQHAAHRVGARVPCLVQMFR